MANTCIYCGADNDPSHYNCQKELETRLMSLHGTGENIIKAAAKLKSLLTQFPELEAHREIRELLKATDPLNLQLGSNHAQLAVQQWRLAENVAQSMADPKRTHETPAHLDAYKDFRLKRGINAGPQG